MLVLKEGGMVMHRRAVSYKGHGKVVKMLLECHGGRGRRRGRARKSV